MRFLNSRPSAAFIVAVFALSFAVVGSAIAGTDSAKKALSKSQVKKIAKKQADKEINKKAARPVGRPRDQRRHGDLCNQRCHGDERQLAVDLRARQHQRHLEPQRRRVALEGPDRRRLQGRRQRGHLLREPAVVQDVQRGD